MDVQSWLENTADRTSPDQPKAAYSPHFAQSQLKKRNSPRSHHTRRRASSTSLQLVPKQEAQLQTAAVSCSKRRSHGYVTDPNDEGTQSFVSKRSSDRVLCPAPKKSYAKRARHKTRPDRYEAKHKRREDESVLARKDETSRKRRKTRPRGDGARTSGLVENFRLNNGSREKRLTVKGDARAGIFKHGRASAQVKGRGNGLPDLTFNEMRFLQEPQIHQDADYGDEPSQQLRKIDRKRAHDGEISVFFTTDRPSRAGLVENEDTHNVEATLPARKAVQSQLYEAQNEAHRLRRNIAHPWHEEHESIKMLQPPSQGLGSREDQPKHWNLPMSDTARLTWSKSPSRSLLLPCREQPEKVSHSSVPDTQNHPRQHLPQQERGTGCDRAPNRSAKPDVHNQYNKTPGSRTTTQSLPRRVTSKAESNSRINHAVSYEVLHDTYRTSDILDIGQSPPPTCPRQGFEAALLEEKENQPPASSFSIDEILGDAQKAATMPMPHTRIG